MVNKRRKPEDDDKKVGLKRLKPDNASDFSESSDSENSNKRATDSSSEHSSESELKAKSTSKSGEEEEEDEDSKSQGSKAGGEEPARIGGLSPREEREGDGKGGRGEPAHSTDCERQEERAPPPPAKTPAPEPLGCIVEMKSTVKTQPKDHYGRAPCVIDITEEGGARPGSRESSEAVSALLASQKAELYVSEPRHLVLKPAALDCRKLEAEQLAARSLGAKMEFAHSEVIRPVTSVSESAAVAEREKAQQYASVAEDVRKPRKASPSPDVLKPKCNPSPDIVKSKTHSVLETAKPKPNTSPEVSKHKMRYPDAPGAAASRPASRAEPDAAPPRSGFKPVPAREAGPAAAATKSPLIIDKNEHFTVYRDPALVRPEADANHMAFLHQHLHPLHASSHPTCLTANTHHPSHLLPGSPINAHHPVHHPHLLPGVLPGMPPASLLGGHPRLDSGHAGGLGHLALAHHHPHQQQQFLQQQAPPPLLAQTHSSPSYSQLGLYPIIWQYPNGTHSYPGLGLPSSKWVHPENAVNSEAGLRRVGVFF